MGNERKVMKMVDKAQQLAALAQELQALEDQIADSVGWLHEGMCDCEQCLYELRKLHKLHQRKSQVLREIKGLTR